MTDRVIYISGPMAKIEDFNRAAFREAREKLRSMTDYVVLCPSENSDDGTFPRDEDSRIHHIRRDIECVLKATEVTVLEGWEDSRGACLEVAVALEFGLPVWRYYEPLRPPLTFADHPWYVTDPRNPSYADVDVFQAEVKEWAYRNFGDPAEGRSVKMEALFEAVKALRYGRNHEPGALLPVFEALQAVETAGPDAPAYRPLLGSAEELGELARAHLKGEQGIRFTPEEIADKKIDAVGDVIVYLADYCNREGISLYGCLERAWGEVKQRDWKKNLQTGISIETSPAVPAGEAFVIGDISHDPHCIFVLGRGDCDCGAWQRGVVKITGLEDSNG